MNISFRKKIIRDFGRAAKTYDNYAILQRLVTERLLNLASIKVNENIQDKEASLKIYTTNIVRILDIGCGTGYFHELLRKNKIYLPLVQADISLEMCNIAASYASSPEYGETHTIACDMHDLPFGDGSFSRLFSSMTMQWSDEIQQVISEAKRVMTNKGEFTFSIVGEGSLWELKEAFSLAGLNPPIHIFISKEEIKEKLNRAEFQKLEIFSETITMFYEDIKTLLRTIKNVGAGYKGNNQMGLRGKKYFAEVEKIYSDRFANSQGLPLSWNIIYVKGQK